MMIHFNLLLNAFQKTVYLNFSGLAQLLCQRVILPFHILIRQPDFSCPESRCPVIIINGSVKSALTVSLLKFIGKISQISYHLLCPKTQGVLHLFAGNCRHILKQHMPSPIQNASSPALLTQPFNPVDATPSTKYFCRHKNTMITGIKDTTEPAMIRPYSAEYCPINIFSPSWIVFFVSVFK